MTNVRNSSSDCKTLLSRFSLSLSLSVLLLRLRFSSRRRQKEITTRQSYEFGVARAFTILGVHSLSPTRLYNTTEDGGNKKCRRPPSLLYRGETKKNTKRASSLLQRISKLYR
jgi:hypothetical protein